MSKEGLEKVAKIFSNMQETRQELLKSGVEGEKVDDQDLLLAALLETMNQMASPAFTKLTLMPKKEG